MDIISCALYGQPHSPASSRKGTREYRYYRCSTRDKRGRDSCPAAPLPAQAIEDFVVARVRDALADGSLAADVELAVKERLAGERAALVSERQEMPAQIAAMFSEGKPLVESLSSITGTGRRLFDTKLQSVGDQLGRLEARLRDVERRLCILDDCEVEAEWVSRSTARPLSTDRRRHRPGLCGALPAWPSCSHSRTRFRPRSTEALSLTERVWPTGSGSPEQGSHS
jgi:hypothetical protein